MSFYFLDSVVFKICFQNGFAWLMLLLFVFLFTTIVVGAVLMAIGKMIREKDETGVVSNPELMGKNVKLIPITFRCNPDQFESRLLTLPLKSIQLLKQWFRFDFLFMFCLYPFMFFLLQWLHNYSLVAKTPSWLPFINFFGWLVLAIWILDALENIFALDAIKNTTYTNVNCMRLASLLKWAGTLFYALPVLLMLFYEIYLRCNR